MKHVDTTKYKGMFTPLIASRAVQAAMMVLKPGESSSENPENEHPAAEQWLLVIAGSGRAKVGRRTLRLREGSLLLIERGESHQITNTGKQPMTTVNFYAPPAYTKDGDVKPSVKRA